MLPQVPTLAESGVKGADVYSWQAIAAPKGLPADVKTKLHKSLVAALQDPAVHKKLTDVGFEIVANTPEQFAQFQAAEFARWKKVIETGKITDATLHHRAAKVTLKLVAQAGGEAFAGTAFSVLTPGGDVIREAIGAFPQVILAEGDYVLIARQEGQVYSRDFKDESGIDRDIEVLAK